MGRVIFKIKDDIILEQDNRLTIDDINNIKNIISMVKLINIDDIEVEHISDTVSTFNDFELSDYDVTADGVLISFKDFEPINGIKCLSNSLDDLLDKICEKNVEEFFVLTK